MRFTDVIAASLVAPLVVAHGGIEGAPRFLGLPKELRARSPFARYQHQARHVSYSHNVLKTRQSDDPEMCGPANNNQTCASDKCCSPEGFCGTTKDHCAAPDCLFDFGPACDANKTPRGETTRNDPRPQKGAIPYGGDGIYSCNKKGTVAITYDDGPYNFTTGVLQLFKDAGFKATFFITGNNLGKGAIDESWASVIKQMDDEGHQIASHTWSHQDLSNITEDQVYDQVVKNEMAIRNIVGKYPTYLRPPYSSCTEQCQKVVGDLGYVISYFDLDTTDYTTLDDISKAETVFKNAIDDINNPDVANGDGDKLAIAHDIHEVTATTLTKTMIDYLKANNLTGVTIGECLNDDKANWYRDSTPADAANAESAS